jgi:hypothetical protein
MKMDVIAIDSDRHGDIARDCRLNGDSIVVAYSDKSNVLDWIVLQRNSIRAVCVVPLVVSLRDEVPSAVSLNEVTRSVDQALHQRIVGRRRHAEILLQTDQSRE